MTIQQLKCFIELSEELHFSKAADHLFISQAAFSYNISSLEKEMNTRLFDRTRKTVALTPQGTLFLPYAKQMIASLEAGAKKLHSYQSLETDLIRISYTRTIAIGILPKKLHELSSNHPSLHIELIPADSTEDALYDLQEGKADLALSYGVGYDMMSFPVYTQDLMIAVPESHPLAKKNQIELPDILHEEFVSGTEKGVMRDHLFRIFDYSGMKPHIGYTSNDIWTILMYVAMGKAISLIPEGTYHMAHVIYKKLNHPIARRNVYLSCLYGATVKAGVKTVVDYFVDTFKENTLKEKNGIKKTLLQNETNLI